MTSSPFALDDITSLPQEVVLCQNHLCCNLNYTFDGQDSKSNTGGDRGLGRDEEMAEKFYLGAFDGMHTLEGKYYIQVRSQT